MSAFDARTLAASDYRAEFTCEFLPRWSDPSVLETFSRQRQQKQVSTESPFEEIPKRLWKRLIVQASISEKKSWAKLSDQQTSQLINVLKRLKLSVSGKGVFKEEFVTSGGLPLKEVDVYCMESKRVPGLFVAGELLDVDGITGGFNFQNAWATGFIAGEGLAG